MKLCLTLLCCVALGQCAPPRVSELTRAAESALSLAQKILSDLPAVHERCVQSADLSFSAESQNLEYLSADIGIPAAPVLTSEDLTLDERLTLIASGLDLHRELLQELKELRTSEELQTLITDLRDLRALVLQMQQLLQTPSGGAQSALPARVSGRLGSDYQIQVAVHLSLQQLRGFTQDVYRSLRRIAGRA